MGERTGAYRVLVRKSEGKRLLGIPRLIYEDNIKMDLRKWDMGAVSIWPRIGTGGGHL